MANAASTLSDMFKETREKGQSKQTEPCFFDAKIFGDERPELSGYLSEGIDVPLEVDEGTIHGCGWDHSRRRVVISKGIPMTTPRSAFELSRALQYGALARDDSRGDIEEKLVNEKRVISTYVAWCYSKAHLTLDPEEIICEANDVELYKNWETTTPAARLQHLAEGFCRWDDPQEVVDRILPICCLLEDAKKLLPGHEAAPLVPSGFCSLEMARQRLIRAALDGRLSSAVSSMQKSQKKRLDRMAGETVQPYFARSLEEHHAMLARPPPEALSPAHLVMLVQMETVIDDINRNAVGRLAS
eukprot:TRINITY_DN24817_c0_g1_i1.p1 TRINITY_DN24817_c0_g1~~TRINITY_DN24817_c0_g1_i1.p1  ORF type:complete len:301 (+),score=47.62 TRINITY_DN24817_c0_g1_i1:56-958(+)